MLTVFFIISVFAFATGIYQSTRIIGNIINPFALIFLIFLCQVLSLFFDPFNTLPVPGAEPSFILSVVLAGSAIAMLFGTTVGLTGFNPKQPAKYQGIKHIGVLISFCSIASILSLLDLILKSGGAPLLLMGQRFSEGEGALYTEYFTNVFMYGLGLNRISAIILAVDYGASGLSLKAHLKKNRIWYIVTLTTSAAMVLGGQRNCFFITVLTLGMAYLIFDSKHNRSLIPVLITSTALGLAFAFVGNLRLGVGERSSFGLLSYMKGEPPDNPVTRTLVWIPIYLAPAMLNLNAELLSGYEPMMGKVLLTKTVPDVLLPFETIDVEMIIDYLEKAALMPLPGQTFRTAMGDFYGDFGVVGAILIPGLVCLLIGRAFRNCKTNLRWSVTLFALIPGLALMPFLDYFTGSQNLIPLLSIAILPTIFSKTN